MKKRVVLLGLLTPVFAIVAAMAHMNSDPPVPEDTTSPVLIGDLVQLRYDDRNMPVCPSLADLTGLNFYLASNGRYRPINELTDEWRAHQLRICMRVKARVAGVVERNDESGKAACLRLPMFFRCLWVARENFVLVKRASEVPPSLLARANEMIE